MPNAGRVLQGLSAPPRLVATLLIAASIICRVFTPAPIAATIFGIPSAVIVLAAFSDASLPLVGSGRGALIGLWVVGSVMCSFGISAMKGRYGLGRSNLVGVPLGIAATALVFAALFSWTALLQPLATAMAGSGQPVSLDRAAIVGVGAIMTLKWAIAWLAELPRR